MLYNIFTYNHNVWTKDLGLANKIYNEFKLQYYYAELYQVFFNDNGCEEYEIRTYNKNEIK